MYYEKVFRALQKNGVEYLTVGGVALVIHGVVRFTADLDLFVGLETGNLKRFLSAMDGAGYVPKMPLPAEALLDPKKRKNWAEEKNMVVFSFYLTDNPINEVDVFISEPVDFGKAYSERDVFKEGGTEISVASPKWLKKIKKASGRAKDLEDIENLEKLKK